MTTTIGSAVIGIGHIGKRHIEEINKNPDICLLATYDSDPKKNTLPSSENKLQDILSNPAIHVVHICTPNASHGDLAIQILNHNKHVVIEKPMCLTTKTANDIVNLAIEKNLHVFCVMQNRYSPVSQWLKQTIESNILGEIYTVQIQCAWNRDDRYYKHEHWHGKLSVDGGPLYTQFSHFVDLLFWLFGKVEIKDAEFYNYNHKHNTEFEDSGNLNCFLPNFHANCLFQYTTSIYDQNFESSITIIAEKGTIKASGQYMDKITYVHAQDLNFPELTPTAAPNLYPEGYQGSANNHSFIIQNVVDTLNGKSSADITPNDGKSVVEIIENAYKYRDLNKLKKK